MSGPRAVRLSLAALLLGLAGLGLASCLPSAEVEVLETSVVTWSLDGGPTLGQVIVRVRNGADRPVDPDVLGGGRTSFAQLLDPDGSDLAGGDARVQLHGVPHVLDPGETGYLIGTFSIGEPAERVADAHIELNTGVADPRAPVAVEGFELVESAEGVGAQGRLEWDGAGTAVARAIALDAGGRVLGYLATSEVLYTAGDFTMCCFPPTVERDAIDEVAVFGDQAREEN